MVKKTKKQQTSDRGAVAVHCGGDICNGKTYTPAETTRDTVH